MNNKEYILKYYPNAFCKLKATNFGYGDYYAILNPIKLFGITIYYKQISRLSSKEEFCWDHAKDILKDKLKIQ